MTDSGITEFCTGTNAILNYVPDSISKEGAFAQFMSVFGAQLTQATKIREYRVLDQFHIDKAWERNLEKIGEGYANTKRFNDSDTKYRARIKAITTAPHGGTLATFTGTTLSQNDTGSFFELHKTRKYAGDGHYPNAFVRAYDETGDVGKYEFITRSGQTLGTSKVRLDELFERIQALGTQYSFHHPIPTDRDLWTTAHIVPTGGWIGDTGNSLLFPLSNNSGMTWYSVESTGIYHQGTGAIWVRYPSESYGDTGWMGIHKGFPAVNVVESGNTILHFWTHVDYGVSVAWVTGANIFVFDSEQKQKTYGVVITEAYYGTGEASGYPLISATGDYGTASPSYDDTGNLMATYSFEADAIDGDPAGWTITEDATTHCDVIASQGNHAKILEFFDNNAAGSAGATQVFADQTAGTIEYWFNILTTGTHYITYCPLIKEGTTSVIYIFYDKLSQQLTYYTTNPTVAHTIFAPTPDTWYHIRINFDVSTGWTMIVDDTDVYGAGNTLGFWGYPATGINTINFNTRTQDYGADYKFYVDAVDYSWDTATGSYQVPYFVQRNRYFARNKRSGTTEYKTGGYYNYYGYSDQQNKQGMGAIPTGWTQWNIDLHNYSVSGDTFADHTGTYFDATSLTGVQFRIAGESGNTVNLVIDQLSFEKQYSYTGNFQ